MKLLIITSDKRQNYMAERLKENGFDCTVYTPDLSLQNMERYFDGVVFALPSIKLSRVNCEYDVRLESVLSLVKKGGYAFVGMAEEAFLETVEVAGLKSFDYYKREELGIRNAYLTAEGVLEIILVNSEVTMKNLKILVTGYGKTGHAIADVLKRNYVDVSVAARKERDRARAEIGSLKSMDFSQIENCAGDFDFVINTVPQEVIGENLLKHFREDCVFVEVASKPYGIDITSAEKQNKRVIIAASLPGKYVAKSAGFFIADTIINIVKEEGING